MYFFVIYSYTSGEESEEEDEYIKNIKVRIILKFKNKHTRHIHCKKYTSYQYNLQWPQSKKHYFNLYNERIF